MNGFKWEPPERPEGWEAFEREILESFNRQVGIMESAILYDGFGSHATTSRTAHDATLTLEKLQHTMNEFHTGIAETLEWTPEPPGAACEIFPTLSWPLCGIKVCVSDFLGDQVVPQPPPMKGPYQRRRLRRWYAKHPPYTKGNGKFLIANKREVWCHPDDYEKLKAALAAVRPADKEGS